jgi:hypothetical protein
MKEISIKKYVRYFFGVTILIFFLNKFLLRPWILENESSEFFQIIVLSMPNLIEAIIGTLLGTGILLQARQYLNNTLGAIKDAYVHLLAVLIVSVYVISQELKFHNLGGNNVYDRYDIIASFIGLILTYGIIELFGFSEEAKNDVLKSSTKE